DYKVFALKEPARLVVDLPGLMSFLPYKTQDFPSPLLNKIRYGEHQDYLRMVLDSPTAEVSSFDVVPLPNGITLFLGTGFEGKKETLMASAASVPKGIEPTPLGSTEPEETFEQGKEEAPVLLAKAEGGEQTEGNLSSVGEPSLESETQTSLSEVSPEASSSSEPSSSEEESNEQPQGASQNEVLAQKDETTSAPEGTSVGSDPVSSPATDSPEVSSPSASTQPAEETDEPSPQIAESTNTQPQPAQGKEVSQASVEPPSFNPVVGEEGEGLPQYTGEHISLDFKDADVRNILRLIADVSNLNIVAGDDVQGTVTVKLNDVPWDQALDVILLSNNLGKTLEGNILRVVPLERLNRERQAAISDKETADKLEPLKKGLIPVSYADAKGLKEVVLNTKALSPRGSIEIDPRTNIMIVIDIEKNIQEVRTIVDQLDTPTPQVLIEAKVVQINPTYTKELGVTWDSGYSGTSNDGLFGIGGNQGVDIDLGQGTVTTKGNIIDLAPAVGQGIGGAISFGFLNPKFGIFQKIAALEKEEKLEIVSSPRIMTIDNEEAIIEQGVDLPYPKLSEEGVTSTEFKKATLSLKVIPHVTADRSILMEIEVKKDQKSAQTGAGGEPGIDTRRAETKILVRNGDTVVIGGIYEETTQDIHNSIPFFGRLPLVSWMFKNTKKAREKTELIVFITPTIITFPKATQKEMVLSSPN
ncbi:MAG: type IV pilus secretin PilQ, partial [Pseudomonadota bacterium]